MNSIKEDHDPSYLGDLERDVLKAVWKHQPVAAEAVRQYLDRGHRESTIRTVLHRLEKKGYLKHTVENRTYVYTAAKAPRHVAAMAVRRIADWLCEGSMEELLIGMVDTDIVAPAQLKKLSEKIQKAKGRKK